MGYKLEFIKSPNYTPGSQAKAIYGVVRSISFGAGHWWGDPKAGYSHDGVVRTFLNTARQASAHAVVSAGRVTEMVLPQDIAWATNNANPFTYAIEVDPRMYLGGPLAEQIKETLCEYIADKGYHNLQWYPHNHWKATQCNPLPWGAVMNRAKQIWANKNTAPIPKPSPVNADLEWGVFPEGSRSFVCNKQPTKLWNFNQTLWAGFGSGVKEFNQGDRIDIYGYCRNKTIGATYLVTKYSYDNKITNGFNELDLTLYVAPAPAPIPEPPKPEWIVNLVDIDPIKLMVLVPETFIYDLNSLQPIKGLAKGTYVDFVKKTTVKGFEYLISSYSATNAIPNGIPRADVGVPAEPPAQEKPEWIKNWTDIADVTMYTRIDAPLVNLLDGSTISVIPKNTPVEIASATFWHGQQYLITKYSTEKNLAQGISLVDLDMNPIKEPEKPVEPAPEQPSLDDKLSLILRILKAIASFFKINY